MRRRFTRSLGLRSLGSVVTAAIFAVALVFGLSPAQAHAEGLPNSAADPWEIWQYQGSYSVTDSGDALPCAVNGINALTDDQQDLNYASPEAAAQDILAAYGGSTYSIVDTSGSYPSFAAAYTVYVAGSSCLYGYPGYASSAPDGLVDATQVVYVGSAPLGTVCSDGSYVPAGQQCPGTGGGTGGGQSPSCASSAPSGVLCITSPPGGSTIAATDGKFLTPQPSKNERQPTARKLTVRGVAPAGDTSITLNGQKVPVTAAGTWTAKLPVTNASLGSLTLTAADANTTAQVMITLIDLQVASPAENSSWPITAAPAMPTFNAQAQVAGYSGDTSSLALNWTMDVRGKYINRSGWHKYPQTLFTGSATGTASQWNLPQGTPVVGGVGRLSVSANIPGVLDEPVRSEPRWISIPGTDPNPEDVNNLVSSLDAADAGTIEHLFCWESGGQNTGSYPMFNPAANAGETALTDIPSDWMPNPPVLQPNLGAPPAGIGIAQLDPAKFPGQQWDWTQNVSGGVTMYQHDLKAASKLLGNEQSRLDSERQQALKIVDSNRAAAKLPPLTPPQKVVVPAEPSYGGVDGVTADAITRYNTGSAYSLFHFDYHYMVSPDGLQVLTEGSRQPQWIAQDGKWQKTASWQAAGGVTTLRAWIANPSWNPDYVSQVMGCSL
jgi:hypothetical protein